MQIPALYVNPRLTSKSGGVKTAGSSGAPYSIAPLKAALQLGERELLARFLAGVFPGEGQELSSDET